MSAPVRYDINIAVVISVEAYDIEDARDLAELAATRVKQEAEYVCGFRLLSPPPFAMVEHVTKVGG